MKFKGDTVAFGRHETFALRYGWLTKGYKALRENISVFDQDDATIVLGVGKNMVSSIRYWMRATQVIEGGSLTPTAVGRLIFESFDPYLEDEATIWLLHWLIASNPEFATSWYWFFNKFHKPEFTSQELVTALGDFIKDKVQENRRPSLGTIKNDAHLLHRMYTLSTGNTRTPIEDALDSPLSLLGLVTQSAGGRSFQSRPEERAALPEYILGFAVMQILRERNTISLPIEDIMYSRDTYSAPGSVFRLTESALLKKLEMLVQAASDIFEIRESAGVHQLYLLAELEPHELLGRHYEKSLGEKAA